MYEVNNDNGKERNVGHMYTAKEAETEEKIRNNKWLRHQDGSICRTWISRGIFNLIKLDICDGELEGYNFYKIPIKEIEITEGDTVKITVTGRNHACFGGSDLTYYPIFEDDLDEYADYVKVKKIFRDSENAEIKPMFLDDTILLRPAEEVQKERELYSQDENDEENVSDESLAFSEVEMSMRTNNDRIRKLVEEMAESGETVGEVMNVDDADKDDYHVSIKKLPFTKRPYNCFRRAGVLYLDEVLPMTYKDLIGIRNFGKKSVVETINMIDMLQNL